MTQRPHSHSARPGTAAWHGTHPDTAPTARQQLFSGEEDDDSCQACLSPALVTGAGASRALLSSGSGPRRVGGSAGLSGGRDVPAPAGSCRAHAAVTARVKAGQEAWPPPVWVTPGLHRAWVTPQPGPEGSVGSDPALPPPPPFPAAASTQRSLFTAGCEAVEGGEHAEPTGLETSRCPRPPCPEPDGTAALVWQESWVTAGGHGTG